MNNKNNRTVVITGGTGGIGFQSALGIAKTGARVIITGRNRERGEVARQLIVDETGNQAIELVVGDISSKSDIDALVLGLSKGIDQIDVLVNNAGYLGSEPMTNHDGLEMHFAINVFAPWYLTHALLPTLKAASKPRVLNVTGGAKPARIDPDNLQAEKGFKGLMTYQHSKSILEAMSIALAQKLDSQGITVNVVFPGQASTSMTSSLSTKSLPGPMKLMLPFFRLLFKEDGGKSAARAAKSTIWGSTSPDLDGVTGRYFDTNMQEQKLHPTAYDKQVQSSILTVIEALE